jgi:N-acyl-D-aspartate/D-glutamate deacylase
MPELTLAIRNARLVDGTGSRAVHGDLGVQGDRIVAVGKVDGKAATEIDAGGKVVSPGFLDIHTHYDPQLCWDGLATPSPEHGVTSLIAGNCSLSLAPVRPDGRAKLKSLFRVVEDFQESYFDAAVPFDWESMQDYLQRLRGTLGPNVGMLVGHSSLRLYVMGEAGRKRAATDEEIAQMCAVLRESMRAGALGLSYTLGHIDELGELLPCHYADRREKAALCHAMMAEGRAVVEIAPNFMAPHTQLDTLDECAEIALETGATYSMSPLLHTPSQGNLWLKTLARLESWQARGARIYYQTQTRPLDMTFRLSRATVILNKQKTWSEILNRSVPERIKAFRDPSLREQLEKELTPTRRMLEHTAVKAIENPKYKSYLGRTLKEITEQERRSYSDALLELALADELETEFEVRNYIHADPDIVGVLLGHPGLQIGSADAGAHVAQFAGAGDTCYLFERFVRELGIFSVEQAVRRLTSELASAWNIADRGVLAPGKFADIVVFDPATIARGEEEWVQDLPGGGGRYVRHPTGVHQVIVNGQIVIEHGRYTGARPGRII